MNRVVWIAASILALQGPAGLADEAAGAKPPEAQKTVASPLLDPSLATLQAPPKFRVELTTTKGPVVIEVNREWAPNGADRFYNLVKIGFFDDIAFFRVIPNFMAQFGIHGDPAVAKTWRDATIQDDPVVQSNERGFLTYAKTARPHSRSTQFFINLKANKALDMQGFAPFVKVVEGMDAVDAIFKVGEGAPRGPGPAQRRIQFKGNAYLKEAFPKLDYVKGAVLLE